jgi:hypothetical protein
MAAALLGMAEDSSSEAVKLNAIRDALDRAGLGAKTEVSFELKPWEMLLQDISGIAQISRDEHRANPGRAIIEVDDEPHEPVTGPHEPHEPHDDDDDAHTSTPTHTPSTQLMTMEDAARPYIPRWHKQ